MCSPPLIYLNYLNTACPGELLALLTIIHRHWEIQNIGVSKRGFAPLTQYLPLSLLRRGGTDNQTSFRLWLLPLIQDLRWNGPLNLNAVGIYEHFDTE